MQLRGILAEGETCPKTSRRPQCVGYWKDKNASSISYV
jgi:hypothetical protein